MERSAGVRAKRNQVLGGSFANRLFLRLSKRKLDGPRYSPAVLDDVYSEGKMSKEQQDSPETILAVCIPW